MDGQEARQELVREDAEKPYEPVFDEKGNEIVEDADGQKYEVVKGDVLHDSFTPSQQRKIWEVYIRMAQELPTEGKDYLVRFSFPDPDNNPKVMFRPLTQLGRDYVRHLANVLSQPAQSPSCGMKQHGGH